MADLWTGDPSPWGDCQSVENDCFGVRGVSWCSTAGHGGYRLNEALHQLVCGLVARGGGGSWETFAGGCWYEEDCDAAVVALCYHEDDEERERVARYLLSLSRSVERYECLEPVCRAVLRGELPGGLRQEAKEAMAVREEAEAESESVPVEGEREAQAAAYELERLPASVRGGEEREAVSEAERRRQGVLFSGLGLLPGQLDLFGTDGPADE